MSRFDLRSPHVITIVARALPIALLFASFQAGVANAGVCKVDTRTYCVAGTSTPADWTWATHSLSGSVDAVAAGLSAGDPASDIVAVMVGELVGAGIVASIASPTSCFDVDSCTDLDIDGSTVTTSTPISFNPLIIQVLPEPSSSVALVAGGLMLVGLHRRQRSRSR